jgi:hypothetical protein
MAVNNRKRTETERNVGHTTLNQRVQGSSPCAPTNQIIEIAERKFGSAVLWVFAVKQKVPKGFQRLRAKPQAAGSELRTLAFGSPRLGEARKQTLPRWAKG